jgi:hypothetical protein
VGGSSDENEKCWGAEGSIKRRRKTGWKVQRELVRCSGQGWQGDVEKQEVVKVDRELRRRIEDAKAAGLVYSVIEEEECPA